MLYPNTEGGIPSLEQNQSVSNQGRNSGLGTGRSTKKYLGTKSISWVNRCSHVSNGLQAIAIVQKQAKSGCKTHLNGVKAPFYDIKTRKKGQKTAFLWGKNRYFFDELTPTSTNRHRHITT
ncbi:hypothetical protein MXY24_003862 [Salmonella enterica]|nr:hypothetical protein [Salmonella enterica]EHG7980820.1 hypothetical protein [Salmonella enterica]EHG8109425.1 hypothetical protein [Salmonella enterica]EIG1255103.1 hypothetical protein [Salmonella enterica]EIG1264921.1 hypothetical protein [Salmonella enterica]